MDLETLAYIKVTGQIIVGIMFIANIILTVIIWRMKKKRKKLIEENKRLMHEGLKSIEE